MEMATINKRTTKATPTAFTLVELLVVITIIGILAALITVAAIGALKKAQEARIKAEINQIATAVDDYRNKYTAYPPNSQTDGAGAIDENGVLTDLRRHIKQLAPRSQESDDMAFVLTGQGPADKKKFFSGELKGGITAAEAVVFWLGGFSSDPKFPISGDGGPSYDITGLSTPDHAKSDPIESRKWVFPFDVSRLGPRTSDGYFDDSKGRYIEFNDANGRQRRINFWTYTPPKLSQPYMYFDTSRHPAYDMTSGVNPARYDPPAATALVGGGTIHVHAFKKQNPSYSSATANTTAPVTFINPDKYQILHCGIDNTWDDDSYTQFEQMSADNGTKKLPGDFLLFPTGPFIGDVADTVVNFTAETKIEDEQK